MPPEHVLHLGHVGHDVLDQDEGHGVVHAALPLAPQHLLVARVPLVQHHLQEGVRGARRSRNRRSKRSRNRRGKRSRNRRGKRSRKRRSKRRRSRRCSLLRCKICFQRFPRKPV